jgi:uncharacterized protein (DUF4415 family)
MIVMVAHTWREENEEEVMRVISTRRADAHERGSMKLAKRQAKQLRTPARMKDEDIDFSDIPLLTGNEEFIVGKFCRPVKKSLTIRIDADVLAGSKTEAKDTRHGSIIIFARPCRGRRKKLELPV